MENHRLSAQIEYQSTKHAADIHAMHSLVLNSETDERFVPSSSHRRKMAAQQPQTIPSPTYSTILPKINQAAATPYTANEPSMDDSVTTSLDEQQASQSVRKKSSKKSGKNVPSIVELLNTHTGGLARSRSDFIPVKKDQALSQSAPILALGSSISTTGNHSSISAEQHVSSADKKIAAIVELNLQEIKSSKKLNRTQY